MNPTYEHDKMIKMIARQTPNLQKFVGFNCKSINNDNVVKLFNLCCKLESLDIWDCPAVTFEAVRNIIRILQNTELEDAANNANGDIQNRSRPKLHFNSNTAVCNTTEKVSEKPFLIHKICIILDFFFYFAQETLLAYNLHLFKLTYNYKSLLTTIFCIHYE